jgi:pimeloyl-ACP methyl ester carboxylesterase
MIYRPSTTEIARGKILFVHGMCHGAWCWDQGFMQFFAIQGYDCYAIDLPGHEKAGRNKSVNQFGIKDYVHTIRVNINELGPDTIIIAHSMGGFITQKFLEKYQCKAAVLLGSVPPSGIFKATMRYLKAHPDALKDFLSMDIYAPFVKYAADLYSADKIPAELHLYQDLMRSESFKAVLSMITQPVKAVNPSVPKLILGAEDDIVITLNEVLQTALFQGVKEVVFSGFGHNMMMEKDYGQIAEYIIKWLDELPRISEVKAVF